MKKLRVLIIAGMLVASLALLGNKVLAKSEHGSRPGWGNGDDNHTHTGPPGGTSVRPGEGEGDENHHHTGPPGQSVNPGEDSDDNGGHDENNEASEKDEHVSVNLNTSLGAGNHHEDHGH